MAAFNRSELADLNVFMAIIRRRSFRQAAHELGVTTSALSHTLRNLETRLGVKLLNRNSRSVEPTDAGALLAQKLAVGFATIQEALDELDRYRHAPIGRLRLNVPRDAARLLVSPVLGEFMAAYPQINLDLKVEDRLVDIVAEGFDAGIRYGATVPQDMIAVPLTGELRWIMIASPDYLARRGVPEKPADLLEHACIRMRLGDNTAYKWELGNGAQMIRLDVPGALTASDTQAVIDAALASVGIAYCLEKRVTRELEDGSLQEVMPDWSSMGAPFCLYYSSQRQSQPGLRQLMEMIRRHNLPL
ncbi:MULTISPECIES: LysR family transcriptional regulator [Pseudomonas]|uniref:LysR family transcriptional regulator n=1 Tax=Pseudomonas gingeri TaxID=117681 RepID=A0A7Y7WLP8_9PSED|nr:MULTISPECIES: LysR family transcriptional regulator [Pseudomonas]MPQ67878.1 LysR family transcriptional regulator [Pseudomonas sp. MWU12-2323]NWB83512.1 LysR family transcriptional regulator [Pseudomonas gingeri]